MTTSTSTNPTSLLSRSLQVIGGFIAWILFHNVYFLAALAAEPNRLLDSRIGSIAFFALPFVATFALVLYTKRLWLGLGIGFAMLATWVVWIAFGYSSFELLLPPPMGLAVMSS